MNKLYIILVGFTLHSSLSFSQECCNTTHYTEDEAQKLSAYGKDLEKRILEKNPADTALIAQLKGDFSKDLCCGYNDEEIIKISNYLKELEKKDSINNIPPVIVPVEVVEEVKPIETPKEIVPDYDKTILFGTNSSVIKVAKLDGLVAQMKADPKMHITLDGYADATASDEFNLALSKRRAKAVRDYLVAKGIDASRISTNAHGEKDPVAPNSTEEGKAQNRRVTISIK